MHERCQSPTRRAPAAPRQLAVNGNREAVGRRALGMRERAGRVAKVRETRLQMERNRVVDFVADPLGIEMALERIALGRPDDELVVDVTAPWRLPTGRRRRRPSRSASRRNRSR